MGDFFGKIDLEKMISYGDDIIAVLKDKRDTLNLTQCLEHYKVLRSSCDVDFSNIQSSLQDYEQKIDACQQKTMEAKSETATDAELDILQNELEEEIKKENLLMEELSTVVTSEINDLEHQRVYVQERRQTLKKLEQDEIKAQRTLSMYASVSNIIPDLDDLSKISGHIVDRNKRFEFDPAKLSDLDTCNTIWKLINS